MFTVLSQYLQRATTFWWGMCLPAFLTFLGCLGFDYSLIFYIQLVLPYSVNFSVFIIVSKVLAYELICWFVIIFSLRSAPSFNFPVSLLFSTILHAGFFKLLWCMTLCIFPVIFLYFIKAPCFNHNVFHSEFVCLFLQPKLFHHWWSGNWKLLYSCSKYLTSLASFPVPAEL